MSEMEAMMFCREQPGKLAGRAPAQLTAGAEPRRLAA
jgi:hypothetical protein